VQRQVSERLSGVRQAGAPLPADGVLEPEIANENTVEVFGLVVAGEPATFGL